MIASSFAEQPKIECTTSMPTRIGAGECGFCCGGIVAFMQHHPKVRCSAPVAELIAQHVGGLCTIDITALLAQEPEMKRPIPVAPLGTSGIGNLCRGDITMLMKCEEPQMGRRSGMTERIRLLPRALCPIVICILIEQDQATLKGVFAGMAIGVMRTCVVAGHELPLGLRADDEEHTAQMAGYGCDDDPATPAFGSVTDEMLHAMTPSGSRTSCGPRIVASMNNRILHLTQVTKVPLLDRAGERMGRVADLLVQISDGGYAPVIGITARISGRDVFLPAEQIASLEPGRIRLSRERLDMRRFERRPGEVLLRTDVLGRRLINLTGVRIVRANEIELAKMGDVWCVVGIDVSLGALLRRLLPRSNRQPPSRPFLDWTSVRPFLRHVPGADQGLTGAELRRLHPAQIADLVEAASHDEGQEIIDAVRHDRELEADVFEEMDVEHQTEFLEKRTDEDTANLIARMAPDDAADLIMELEQDRRVPILELLPVTQQRKVRTLLGFNQSTAGGLMGVDFLCLDSRTAVGSAISAVRDSDLAPEALHTIYTHDPDGRLNGAVRLVRVLRHGEDTLLEEIIDTTTPRLESDRELADVAIMMSDFNLTVAPVVDHDDRMIGVVTVDDLLETLIPDEWKRRADALREG